MTILSMRGVFKHRGKGTHEVAVLHNVSLDISRGDIVLLQGPSGSGKTTLLGIAAGLLMADRGEVEIAGHLVAKMGRSELRSLRARDVGFVFQRSNLLSELNTIENVCLMGTLAGMTKESAHAEAIALLEKLGLLDKVNRYPHELSGGQEQRVAVARALVHSPALVFADEPTGNLDGVSGRAVVEALIEIATLRNSAVMVATHDDRLKPISSRHLTIIDGFVREDKIGSNA